MALGPVIADRLGLLPGPRGVFTTTTLDALATGRGINVYPSVHVIYLGDRLSQAPASVRGAGAAQVVDQVWLVALAVQHHGEGSGSERRQSEAGPLLAAIIQQLGGWAPPLQGVRPLVRVPAPAPVWPPSRIIYPLAYLARIFAP